MAFVHRLRMSGTHTGTVAMQARAMPRPQRRIPPYDADAVRALFASQTGVVAARQLAALGVSDSDLARWQRRRVVRRLSLGVYTDQVGELSPLQRARWATLRHSGSGLCDQSALEVARDGSGSLLTLPVHVAVPPGRNVTALPGVLLHRVSGIERLVVPVGLPRMRPEHAALRLASRALDTNAVVAALADAVTWRTTRPARLRDALTELPRLPPAEAHRRAHR